MHIMEAAKDPRVFPPSRLMGGSKYIRHRVVQGVCSVRVQNLTDELRRSSSGFGGTSIVPPRFDEKHSKPDSDG